MPAILPDQLVSAIVDAIHESGETGALVSPLRKHPRKFAISGPDRAVHLWVYAWTLTPGGRPQLPNEYRIQMTSVTSPLTLNGDGPTILIGYEPDLKMFVGFDLGHHTRFTAGSPMVSTDIRTVRTALQDGLAFHRKKNDEITVGIRPDLFMTYVHNAHSLHKHGRHHATFDAMVRASTLQSIADSDLARLSSKRQRIIQTVSRVSRAANFREQVLNAYGHRCAVTRMQLRLVEAAHVLPVAAPGSHDVVTNGIALSPTYHRAYDSGLIYLDGAYHMRINSRKTAELEVLKLDAGIERLTGALGRIHLPADRHQWPNPRLIKRANKFRRIG